jgi:hypothetical protein
VIPRAFIGAALALTTVGVVGPFAHGVLAHPAASGAHERSGTIHVVDESGQHTLSAAPGRMNWLKRHGVVSS